MTVQSHLRTMAGTFLVTSLLWGAGLVWWGNPVTQGGPTQAPAPGPIPVPSPVAVAPPGQTQVAYRPDATVVAGTQSSSPLTIPVVGVRRDQLTDTFTAARENGARVHDAIDIMAPLGTPVIAAADGTVEKLFTSKAGGLTIYIRCDDRRFIHYYAHLDHYAPGLAEGQHVLRGQTIGAVGFTGNASPTAPHLHFAVQLTTPEAKWYEPSTAINPYPLLMGR